ncbi:hypothetical protein N7534_008272 [Penicillium rubens]|jgi:hypothetical protein|nr:hypothetical protein N7534_008272 [Penicillium rubens]
MLVAALGGSAVQGVDPPRLDLGRGGLYAGVSEAEAPRRPANVAWVVFEPVAWHPSGQRLASTRTENTTHLRLQPVHPSSPPLAQLFSNQ